MSIDEFLDIVYDGRLLTWDQCQFLCEKIIEILINEHNVVHLQAPISVVGDIHGQFHDLLELFHVGGQVPDNSYLFLGDYVDRGQYSVPTICLLLCLKIRYPDRVSLLRGNHECRQITQVYGFYNECCMRYGQELGSQVWKSFTDMFDYLPIAAIIDNHMFCTHGGLSPTLPTIHQIKCIQRFQEIPAEGSLADLMWSDPDSRLIGFRLSSRGAGYLFGEDIFNKFMHRNGFEFMIRAHQLCMEGYQQLFMDRLATVWSAPNYCLRAGNKASVLQINSDHSQRFLVFDACPSEKQIGIQYSFVSTEGDSRSDQKSRINPDYFL